MFLSKMKSVNSVGACQVASFVSNSLQPYGSSPLQTTLSMGFSWQEYWSALLCPPPGDLPEQGIETVSLMSPVLADELGIPLYLFTSILFYHQSISNNKS